jgi:polysaccharide export outer membrane protein
MPLKLFIALALSACLMLPGGLRAAADEGRGLGGYPRMLIGPGDLLSITVYGEEKDMPTDYLVDSEGSIVFPLVGLFHCSGLTQAQMSKSLAKELKAFEKRPQVTVLIKESNAFTISVLGSVQKPGKYPIRGVPDLLSAISEAGGPNEDAALGSAILVHGKTKQRVDLSDDLQGSGTIKEHIVLYPGDVLMVPKSPWPSWGEWGIMASILSSTAVVIAEYRALH